MKKRKLDASCVMALFIFFISLQAAKAAPIDDLIVGAKQEGIRSVYQLPLTT
jgi:hypothetical protein